MTLRLTRAQVREIDRRATAEYGIPSIVLMENAARGAADVAKEMLKKIAPIHGEPPYVGILCGGGNNGGDGYAIARHLHNRGVELIVFRLDDDTLKGDAAINSEIVRKMKLDSGEWHDVDDNIRIDFWVDAIFGTGLTRPILNPIGELIEIVNQSGMPILAIDLPSGLDCDTGQPLGPCIRATRTVTFVAEKAGFANPACKEFTGDITVADIGVPPVLIDAVVSST